MKKKDTSKIELVVTGIGAVVIIILVGYFFINWYLEIK